mgnify:CR=1 FL=1
MPHVHQAQLRDGRWVRLRELTSDQQAQAYEAASERSPSGALLPNPNPVRLDTEAFKLALVAVSVKKPLWQTDKDGKPIYSIGFGHSNQFESGVAVGATLVG